MNGSFVETYTPPSAPTAEYLTQAYPPTNGKGQEAQQDLPVGDCTFRLEDLAFTRSGDKGNSVNIGKSCMHILVVEVKLIVCMCVHACMHVILLVFVYAGFILIWLNRYRYFLLFPLLCNSVLCILLCQLVVKHFKLLKAL